MSNARSISEATVAKPDAMPGEGHQLHRLAPKFHIISFVLILMILSLEISFFSTRKSLYA